MSLIVSKQFSDFEEYAASAKKWHVNLRQMDPGSFSGRLTQVQTQYVLITFVHLGRRLLIEGETPKNFYNFSIPLNANSATLWYGQNYTPSSIGIGPIENHIDGISQAGLTSIELSISKKYLHDILNKRGETNLSKIIPPQSIIDCDTNLLQNFQKKLLNNINFINSNPNLISNKNVISDLENSIPSELLNTLNIGKVKTIPNTLRRRKQALRKSIDYMCANAHGYPNIGMICKVAGISERTLEYAFKERYCVSPLSFLNIIRLNTVRSILIKSDPQETKINEIAGTNGFWHMGKFAADYKKLFGEFPSETLKRNSKTYRA